MDARQRTWWRLFDDLPGRLGRVHAWRVPQPGIPRGAGGIHPNPTSVICLAGVVRVRACGESTIDLGPGDALLVGPGVWHEHAPLRRGSIFAGQGFLMDCSDLAFAEHGCSWGGRLAAEPSRQLMESALAEQKEGTRRDRLRDLLRHVGTEAVDDTDFSAAGLRPMIDLLWSRFHTGLTVEELLRASGLSRSRAYAVFTAGYGATPKSALETMRLWLASGILASGQPVADTARRCGFGTTGTFTRAWRRAHGRPPRASLSGAPLRK